MTERRSLSRMQRLAVFEATHGVCHLCSLRIQAGDKWEVEHVRPIGLLGADDKTNMAPAHVACHAEKTATDVADIARAKRRKAKHFGIGRSRNLIPGSKGTKFRKRIDGTVVLR